MPPADLDLSELGRLAREKRASDGDISIRQAAQQAQISYATLSRVEAGAQPDLATFTSLCAWLEVDPSRFFAPSTRKTQTHLEEAIEHLVTDPDLPPDAANRIASVVREMYQALASRPTDSAPDRTLAMHLRATNVMRPGVPERMASLLTDMRNALESQLRE
jgi:transcriptional regulator with XRE-family HTH domain